MINTAAISVLSVFMFGLSECNGNKTTLIIGQLASVKTVAKDAELGIDLAYDVAKNSSNFTNFFEKYEIIVDRTLPPTYTDPSTAVVYANFLLTKFKNSSEGANPIIILGPDTPDEAAPVLDLIGFYKKLMVTYQTTTPKRQELKSPYGFSFKRVSSAFNPAMVDMVKHFGWKRAAIVYDFLAENGQYVKVVEDLSEKASGIFNVIAFEAINSNRRIGGDLFENLKGNLLNLKKLDTKIFLGVFDEKAASLIFCELYFMEMFGPDFVWILSPNAGDLDDWVKVAESEKIRANITNQDHRTCTREEFEVVVNRSFILVESDLREDVNTSTDSGLSVTEFLNKPGLENLTEYSQRLTAAIGFDVMWAIMLAMKEASKQFSLELNSDIMGNSQLTKLLNDELRNVSFEGLTGPVSFSKEENRQGITSIRQYQDGGKKLVTVGQHRPKNLVFFNDTKNSLWEDNRVPYDRTIKIKKLADIPPALFIIFSTAAAFGIILGIIFLGFNRYYRKYKFIRLSAPIFNDVMVLGCIMCLSTVFLFGLRKFPKASETMPRICKARAWILNIGFSLAFGAMFIKTWRIYKICTNKRLKVRLGPLSDCSMLAMVGGIVLVDVAILAAFEVTDPLQLKPVNISETHDNVTNEFIVLSLNTCMAKNLNMWLALIYVYKGILLLYGLFLAYETRNVVYAHLNDSRVIGICVYNVVVLSMIGAFLGLILEDKQFKELFAAISVCIIFPATATISLIFIPKLVHRIKMNSLDDETGETTMSNTMARPSIDVTSTYNGTEIGRERFVDVSSTNTLCVYQNGEPMGSLSPIPSPSPSPLPTPPATLKDPSHVNKALEA